MRARNIKPGFFKNDKLLECDPLARILFAGLWCMADRAGRLEDRPMRIKIELLPCDNCDINTLLNQLVQRNFIERYTVDGLNFIQIVKFTEHQHPHISEKQSVIPQHRTSTVQAPYKHRANPSDSLLLIPDSLNPDPVSTETVRARNPQANPAQTADPQADLLAMQNLDETQIHPPAKRLPYPPDFEEFWKVYPRTQCSKQEVFRSYKRVLSKGISSEILVKGATSYADFISKSGSPAAHATTWLNNERWDVDYAAVLTRRQIKPPQPKQANVTVL